MFFMSLFEDGIKNEPATKAQLLTAGSFIRPYGELAEKLEISPVESVLFIGNLNKIVANQDSKF